MTDYTAAEFKAAYDGVRDTLLAEIASYGLPSTAETYIRRMLDYNVPGGKLTRGISVVRAFRCLCDKPEETGRAAILGWGVELLQAYFLVADDIMDDSLTRRGQPCWYRVPGIGLKAANDASILFSCIFILLEKNFKTHPGYVHLIELFNTVCFKTQMGQLLDLESLPNGVLDLNHFTRELYHSIVIYKTAFYSFYLPVALGMIMAGITDKNAFTAAEGVCLEIGEYFQIQDDFLDCYGDEATIGKVGTDIQDAKCSWLVVTALETANEAQREILKQHYGQKSPESVKAIKALYLELDLAGKFAHYEEKSFTTISARIATITELPKPLFEWLLGAIYKRQK